MTRIVWLRKALNDLRGISQFIAKDNPAAARRVVTKIRDDAALLGHHPEMGRHGRIDGTRELVIARFPYIVAYRYHAGDVQILAVVHTSRRWPEQLP
jgi:addiction module RelE/StbE family toxin